MKVTVLTSALPSRAEMFWQAYDSVKAQTHRNLEYRFALDTKRRGAGAVLNELFADASGDWVMVLDDDDLLDPCHLATLLAHTEDADVVYSLPRVEGGTFELYELDFDPGLLARGINCVSHTALMRAELVREVGGWSNVRGFDLDLFCRLERAGAEFRKVPEVTWTYRLHGSNWSQGTLAEAAAV